MYVVTCVFNQFIYFIHEGTGWVCVSEVCVSVIELFNFANTICDFVHVDVIYYILLS